jgi:hypothetical protein
MCAVLVVLANILRELAFQVTLVNCDDVTQEITPPITAKKSLPTKTSRDLSARDAQLDYFRIDDTGVIAW